MKLASRNRKIRRKQKQRKNQFYTFITAVILITGLSTGLLVTIKKEKFFTEVDSELLRTQTYVKVDSENDKIIEANDGSKIDVFFDAFFRKDIDGDGILDEIRGTCNQIGSNSDLYMELSVRRRLVCKKCRNYY